MGWIIPWKIKCFRYWRRVWCTQTVWRKWKSPTRPLAQSWSLSSGKSRFRLFQKKWIEAPNWNIQSGNVSNVLYCSLKFLFCGWIHMIYNLTHPENLNVGLWQRLGRLWHWETFILWSMVFCPSVCPSDIVFSSMSAYLRSACLIKQLFSLVKDR